MDYDPDYKRLLNYRVGGVFEPIHNFSLVNQEIHINKKIEFSRKVSRHLGVL